MTSKIEMPTIPDGMRKRFRIESGVSPNRWARILLSGPPKQGKTAVVGTASRNVLIDGEETLGYNNVFYLEYDNQGSDTFIGMQAEVDKTTPKDYKELVEIVEWLNTSAANQYDVVAIDTYSMLQTKVARELSDGDDVLNIRQFNALYNKCVRFNDLLLSLNKHIIVICHSGVKANPLDMHKKLDEKEMVISLALDGKMAHMLSSYFSIHGLVDKRMHDVDIKFGQPKSETGTRFRMKTTMTNPTFKDILKEAHLSTRLYNEFHWIHDNQGFLPSKGNK